MFSSYFQMKYPNIQICVCFIPLTVHAGIGWTLLLRLATREQVSVYNSFQTNSNF